MLLLKGLHVLEPNRLRVPIQYFGCNRGETGDKPTTLKLLKGIADDVVKAQKGGAGPVRLVTVGGCTHSNLFVKELFEKFFREDHGLRAGQFEVISLLSGTNELVLYSNWFGETVLKVTDWHHAQVLEKTLPHLFRAAWNLEEIQAKIDAENQYKVTYPYVGKVLTVSINPNNEYNKAVFGEDAFSVIPKEQFEISSAGRSVVLCSLKHQSGVLLLKSGAAVPFKFAYRVRSSHDLRVHLAYSQAPLRVRFSNGQCIYQIECHNPGEPVFDGTTMVWQLKDHHQLDITCPVQQYVRAYDRAEPVMLSNQR